MSGFVIKAVEKDGQVGYITFRIAMGVGPNQDRKHAEIFATLKEANLAVARVPESFRILGIQLEIEPLD